MPEERGRYTKVLAEHLSRYVLEPVGDQQCVFFVKVTIVKDQKEFATVWIETLDGVWNPRWEKPKVADAPAIEAHVLTGNVLRDAELARRRLAGPAARLGPHVRVQG